MKINLKTYQDLDLQKPLALILEEGQADLPVIENLVYPAKLTEKTGLTYLTAALDGEAKLIPVTILDKALAYKQQASINVLCSELSKLQEHGHANWQIMFGFHPDADALQHFIRTLYLFDYSFGCYKTSGQASKLNSLDLLLEQDLETEKLEETAMIAETIKLTRDLVNQPANALNPTGLAEAAKAAGKKYGFSCEVKSLPEIEELSMSAFLNVAKASSQEPKFIIMHYNNAPSNSAKVALVGKGLTYDSGGYALKPASSMASMHSDMAGAAAVIGAMSCLASQKAAVNVVGLVAACENMVAGDALKNGDIIPSMSGKYIEIENTDAEGRLTLADAVYYAREIEKADKIIDIATLTGAALVALGDDITLAMTDDEELWAALHGAADTCRDKVWRMPCDPQIAELNQSKLADIKNSGGRHAGAISAGLFVKAFVPDTPLLHLDIAGPSYNTRSIAQLPFGGTGVGCELLYRTVQNLYQTAQVD